MLESISCPHVHVYEFSNSQWLQVKFSIIKNGNEIWNGQSDICNILHRKSARQKTKMHLFGFPTECPVAESRRCVDSSKTFNISKFKVLLPIAAGQTIANYDITHDKVIIQFFVFLFKRQWYIMCLCIDFQGKTCAVVKFEISKQCGRFYVHLDYIGAIHYIMTYYQ